MISSGLRQPLWKSRLTAPKGISSHSLRRAVLQLGSSGLNKNCPAQLEHLSSWALVGGTVWRVIGNTAAGGSKSPREGFEG